MIHSRFSPASMPPELLESTFVQREHVARRLTDLFRESALGESKHHVLLVGPRGVGKSHLVSIVYNRLKQFDELKDRLVIAFLREDEWGITSFLDLLVRILRAIGTDSAGISSLPVERAEEEAWKILRDRMNGKTLLVIVENLETVFRALAEEGQRKWRALIQTHCCWAVLATTPALSADISSQSAPFYGFFEIQNLEGLSVPQAVELLKRLALSQGNQSVADFVTSPAGQARVRAVQHLANGNHRIFVIFYDFLTNSANGELVEPLLKTIDALTPYYQSQMKEISPQQRKLVEFLCEYRRAANVKTIASRCFVSHQTAASQLKQLLKARYVGVTRIGRESYYELNEPLLRICVEAKSRSREPIRLLVEFLRYWFARQELEERLTSGQTSLSKREYFQAALQEYDNVEGHIHLSPDVSRLCAALSLAEHSADKASIAARATELAEVSKIAEDWLHYTRAVSFLGTNKEALPLILKAAQKDPANPDILHALSRAYCMEGQPEKALSVLEEVINLKPGMFFAWFDKGTVLERLGRDDDALQAFSQAAHLDPDWPFSTLRKAEVLLKMGKHKEAQRLLRPLLKYGKRDPDFFIGYGSSLALAGRPSQALVYFKKATGSFPQNAEAWLYRGQALKDLKRPQAALAALERALKIDPSESRVLFEYCAVLFGLGEFQRCLKELPMEVVAHQVCHQLLDMANKEHNKRQIRSALAKLQSSLATEPGPEALAGGLIEFTSLLQRQVPPAELPQLRVWNSTISDLFKDQPRFAIVTNVFDVMVRYKESGDEKVLLELPLEQRKLLSEPEDSK